MYTQRYKKVLERLQSARREAGLTQVAVAEAFGKPQSFVSKCESGERRIDVVELGAFANLYDKPLAYFVAETDAQAPPELLVVNKIDAADGLVLAQLRRALPGAVFVSARTGEGLDRLQARLAEMITPRDTVVDVTIPYSRGDLVNRVHAEGRVDAIEHMESGTRVKARVPLALAGSLAEFATY